MRLHANPISVQSFKTLSFDRKSRVSRRIFRRHFFSLRHYDVETRLDRSNNILTASESKEFQNAISRTKHIV